MVTFRPSTGPRHSRACSPGSRCYHSLWRHELKEQYIRANTSPMRGALALVATLFVVVLMGDPGRAELWCGSGPGTPLDHPCSDQDTEEDPVVAASVASHASVWMMQPG